MRPEETTGAILRRLALPAVFVALIFWAVFDRKPDPTTASSAGAATAPGSISTVELRGKTMGTTFTVKAVGEGIDEDALRDAVSAALEEVNALMSTWRPDSELSRFNAAGTEPFTLSEPTAEVIALSRTVHRQTDGVFDPTVGPLVKRWGFGPDGQQAVPTDAELDEMLTYVGFGKVTLDGLTLTKSDARVQVDLSAIAKGYGSDRVAEAAAAVPAVQGVMAEIGGEVRVIGARGDGGPWRLAIERPDRDRRDIHSIVTLTKGGLATSGDYRRFIEEDGKRRTHVVDPRTGRPVERVVASASVLAADCATADAWATALMVLPPEIGLARVRAVEGVEAMLIVRADDGLAVRTTDGFASVLETAPK
jgi:thiamine biosynthesis lipoprotein